MTTAITESARLMYLTLATPGTHTPIWIGHPGGGKTETEKVIVRALGIPDALNTVITGGQCFAEDLAGLPMPRPEGLIYEPPRRFRRLIEAGRGMIFIDELTNAKREAQQAMLRFIHDRWTGDFELPAGVKIMAAANPLSSADDAQDVARALANRIVWLPFPRVTPEEHADYIGRGAVPEEMEFPVVDPIAWGDAFAMTSGAYRQFITQQGREALHENPDGDEVARRFTFEAVGDSFVMPAYGTPRSWHTAVRLAATCVATGNVVDLMTIAVGTVGPRGADFAAHVANNDLLDANDLLNGRLRFEHDPARPDRTFAQLQAVSLAATNDAYSDKEQALRWARAWVVIDGTFNGAGGIECGAPAAQHLGRNKPAGVGLADVATIIARFRPVLAASVLAESM
jgi:hypothetical protein